MREEAFRKLKLCQNSLELSEEVYSDDLTPVTVDVYLDNQSQRRYQLDKKLRRYRFTNGQAPGAPFGPWKALE